MANVTLPRGRHGLARETVRSSQRERLVEAMLESVEAKGFTNTTITELTRRARVSPNVFYELFEDKEACFIEACEARASALLDSLYELADEPDWTVAVREGARRYLDQWRRHPGFAVAYNVELPAAGRRALAHRDDVHARFCAIYAALARRARVEDERLPPLAALALEVLVTGTTELIGRRVREGHVDQLGAIEDDLVFLIISTVGDVPRAQEEQHRTRAVSQRRQRRR